MNADATSSSSTGATLPAADEMWRDVMAQLRAFVRPRIADPERAEDLVAEILLRIHRNLASLDDRERLPHWVARIARNAVIDEYRRAGPGPRTGRRDRAGRLAGAALPRRTTPIWCRRSCRGVCARCCAGCHRSNAAPSK